jgi:hypothetical protein
MPRMPMTDGPGEPARLTVRRRSAEDSRGRQLYVSLDGRPIAVLQYGQEVTVPVAAGRHQLTVHNTLSRRKAEFEATAGQQLRFRAANVPGRGFASLAAFLGFPLLWTTLEREDEGRPAPDPN